MTLVTTAYELAVRGLLHGDGHTWEVVRLDGLGTPPLRTDDRDLAGRDGADVSAADLYGPRTLVATVELIDDDQGRIDQAVAELKAAWARSSALVPLDVHVEGGPRRMWGRTRGAEVTYEDEFAIRVVCRLVAGDPRMYGVDLRVAALPAEDASGGLAWPAVWPAQWGASETGIVEAANAGGDDAPLVWTIGGPKTNPTLIDVDRGVQLQLTGTVPDGSVVVVDTGARTVELDGVDRWSWVTGDSGWPTVAPGGGRLRETSTAGTGASSIAWRDTWT